MAAQTTVLTTSLAGSSAIPSLPENLGDRHGSRSHPVTWPSQETVSPRLSQLTLIVSEQACAHQGDVYAVSLG
jgi:hypothetical protein